MKRILTLFLLYILIYALCFSAFSYNIDGIDSAREWDNASVYKLVDGESNCGVNFGVVKVKFDYETRAFLLCFFFFDPNFSSDNSYAGISLKVENSQFEFDLSDGMYSENTEQYSFDGAIHLDINNGATCEVRVGVKTGLPRSVDCCVRFIDSQGFYSNYYPFTVINDSFEESDFNPDNYGSTEDELIFNNRTTSRRNRYSTTRPDITIKTSPPYSYTGRTKRTTTEKAPITEKSTASGKTTKNNVTVIYHEKEIYISEVYIEKDTAYPSTVASESFDLTVEQNFENIFPSVETTSGANKISLSKGTKYKKILTVGGLASFIALACFGIYSSKKSFDKSNNGNRNTEE